MLLQHFLFCRLISQTRREGKQSATVLPPRLIKQRIRLSTASLIWPVTKEKEDHPLMDVLSGLGGYHAHVKQIKESFLLAKDVQRLKGRHLNYAFD